MGKKIAEEEQFVFRDGGPLETGSGCYSSALSDLAEVIERVNGSAAELSGSFD